MNYRKNINGQNILPILFILLLLASTPSIADNFSVYLVRHAEKLNNTDNPSLTVCGKLRAKQLASLLSTTNITTIYSTHYQRTMQTARPLASQQKIAIKSYSPKHLEQLSLKLKQAQTNTLIVGHSNTTPRLVSLLAKQVIPPILEQDYRQLYQVQFIDGSTVLTVFQQPLSCEKHTASN